MNAVPPRELAEEIAARRGAEPKNVRLTIDYDEEPEPDLAPPPARGMDAGPAAPPRTERSRPARDAAVPAQLAGIEVRLSVEVGSLSLPLRDLLAVEPGQLFALNRMTSEPVSVLVNGKLFARGEIVAIGDRFGIRLVEIASDGAA